MRMIGAFLAMSAIAIAAQQPIEVRWLGQDGHDLVGPSNAAGPDGVQDIHLALDGLPAGKAIARLKITGYGGGEWDYVAGGTAPHWRAEIVRGPGSPTADVYVEPGGAETGRDFNAEITFDDGQVVTIEFRGGAADPGLRMPTAALAAKWVGQVGRDRVGPGPAVGPDGLQDAVIALERLVSRQEVRSVAIDGPGGLSWCHGSNLDGKSNAELVRDPGDPSRAELYFQPPRDLIGESLAVAVTYADGTSDKAGLTAGATDPKLAMPPPPAVGLVPVAIAASWFGQDGAGPRPGDVHVALSGLPRGRVVAAVALGGTGVGSWFGKVDDRAKVEPPPWSAPLTFRRRGDPTEADLYFAPTQDATGEVMSLRLAFADGSTAAARFPGGKADVGLLAGPVPDAGPEVPARPGQDLQALAARGGRVRLAAGTYRLARPLVLDRPIAIAAEPGATLAFTPLPSGDPWTAAIKILSGHVALDGFAVRFAGPVPWRRDVAYGPAVIGTRDNFDPPPGSPIVDLAFTRLDIEAPPAAGPGPWEEAIKLIRLGDAAGGRIEGCTLRGGPVEFFGGPWTVADNESLGAPPATYSPCVFAGHFVHDVAVRGNRARAAAPAGKTWRFLVFTGGGQRDVVENNRIADIGPRDDDLIPPANSPETILTEGYSLHFEGRPAAIGAGGALLQVPAPQGEPVHVGSTVAVLAGPNAGAWSQVVQVLDARTFLVDPPLPAACVGAVSIASGFVRETFRNNTVEARGGSAVAALVLVGNHYGARVVGNRVVGAGEAFRIASYPTESPVHWGWSHCPVLDLVVEGNSFEGSARGLLLTVDHGPPIKSNRGRVYLTAALRCNTASQAAASGAGDGPAFTIGGAGGLDPGELVLTAGCNSAVCPPGDRPGATMWIHAAVVNGRTYKEEGIALPTAVSSGAAP